MSHCHCCTPSDPFDDQTLDEIYYYCESCEITCEVTVTNDDGTGKKQLDIRKLLDRLKDLEARLKKLESTGITGSDRED